MTVLVVAAHPDDEVLGCGGTIRALANAGERITVLILGEGITSRYTNRCDAPQEEINELHNRAQQADAVLGVEHTEIESFPDNRFDTVPLIEIIKVIEAVIEAETPHTIFTHHAGDLNIDHAITNRAVLTATRPTSNQTVKEVYSFEIPSATEWVFDQIKPIFTPTVFHDITHTLNAKLNAMAIYESESRAYPHPRSHDALSSRARIWGSVVGLTFAEPFVCIRRVIPESHMTGIGKT